MIDRNRRLLVAGPDPIHRELVSMVAEAPRVAGSLEEADGVRPSAGGSGDPSKFGTFAVTGGSGAYSNVGGFATERWGPRREAFAHTFHLVS